MARAQPFHPIVRFAPLGQLNVYAVYEHELETLAGGSTGSTLLNIAYALLPVSASFLIALLTTEFPGERTFMVFVIVCLGAFLGGMICLILGIKNYRSNRALVNDIKNRMPPEGIPADQPSATASSPPPAEPT